MKLYIVGSALMSDSPRDLDIIGVLSDKSFEERFSMDTNEFQEQKSSGNWSDKMRRWANYSIGGALVLQSFSPEIPVDFKFLPESLLEKPNLRIPT